MAMAASLGLRVIFKATFEINLPECGFHQKDFPPDFYLVLCTLSSSACRTLRNCLQVSHPVSYRHFRPLPYPSPSVTLDTCLFSCPNLCSQIHHWYFLLFNSKRWRTAEAKHGATHGHTSNCCSRALQHRVLSTCELISCQFCWHRVSVVARYSECQVGDTVVGTLSALHWRLSKICISFLLLIHPWGRTLRTLSIAVI